MSALAAAAASYLQLRRALGFKLVEQQRLLGSFVSYLDGRGLGTITAEAALAWACLPADAAPAGWARRLGVARGFAAFLRSIDPAAEIPPARLWPQPRRGEPFVCAPAQIAALVDAAGMVGTPLVAATYQQVIGLLAVTGMRVGEAVRLDRDDVDLDDGVLTVRHSKFGKSREVALHPTTVSVLAAYADQRDQRFRHPVVDSFFVSPMSGTRVNDNRLREHWQRTITRAGVVGRDGRRPRMHDLRHSFAVNTLRAWHDSGVDVQTRLPLLSTYLGHVNPAATYWYLTATPDLLGAAARRLETNAGATS